MFLLLVWFFLSYKKKNPPRCQNPRGPPPPPPPPPLLTNVQTYLYALKVVLKGLKHETSSGCNACEVCDGKVIKSNPTPTTLCTTCKVTCELWPLG